MTNLFSIISTFIVLIFIMVMFTKEKMDYVSYSILAVIFTCLTAHFLFRTTVAEFTQFVQFDALIFILSMQIVIIIIQESKIFQWIVLKMLFLTGGNHRKFFYLMCILASFSSAIISDITVVIIFVPIIIRACKILKIDASPYMFGISFTVNIGSIYTPVSSSENIIISSAFNLDFDWFLSNFTLLVIPLLIGTLLLLDFFFLRRIMPPKEERKEIILRVMKPDMVIIDRKSFKVNFAIFIGIIVGFIFYPDAYVVAIIGAVVLCIMNRIQFAKALKQLDWKVLSFLVAIMLLIGVMQINETFIIIGNAIGVIISGNTLVAAFTVLLLVSIFSGFLAQVPTALVFISLIQTIYGPNPPALIIMAFLLGINIGSNFLPQGAACDLISLNMAEKYEVKRFNYKRLLKNGSLVTLFHICNSFLFLFLYSLTNGM